MQCDAMMQLLTTSAYLAGAALVNPGQNRARAATEVEQRVDSARLSGNKARRHGHSVDDTCFHAVLHTLE